MTQNKPPDPAKIQADLPSDAWFAALPLRERPSQARSRATVVRMLRAARDIARSQGVEAVTTAAVAHAIEAPIGTVYRYFHDREDLVLALVAQDRFEIDVEVMRTCAPTDLTRWRQALRDVIESLARLARARPDYLALRAVSTVSARYRVDAAANRWLDAVAGLPGADELSASPRELRRMIAVGIHAIQGNLQTLYDVPEDELGVAVDEVARIVTLYIEDVGRRLGRVV